MRALPSVGIAGALPLGFVHPELRCEGSEDGAASLNIPPAPALASSRRPVNVKQLPRSGPAAGTVTADYQGLRYERRSEEGAGSHRSDPAPG